MKIKSARLSLAIFASLVFLSFAFFVTAENSSKHNVFLDSDQDGMSDEEEKTYGTDPHNKDTDNDGYSDGTEVSSGYDPTKPAPGDKLVEETPKNTPKEDLSQTNNVTKKLAYRISKLATSNNEEDNQMSLDQLETMVDESISPEFSEEEMPEIDMEKVKVKKQDYSKYSAEKAKEKKKEDLANYVSSVFFVLTSNSPRPVTSGKDMQNNMNSFHQEILNALVSRSSTSLDNLEKSGEKMIEQLYEIEVPEEFLDIHIKSLRFALYAKNLKQLIDVNESDPVADIANLSKIQGFLTEFMSFGEEIQITFAKYGLDYKNDFSSKVKDYGIDLEDKMDEQSSQEEEED